MKPRADKDPWLHLLTRRTTSWAPWRHLQKITCFNLEMKACHLKIRRWSLKRQVCAPQIRTLSQIHLWQIMWAPSRKNTTNRNHLWLVLPVLQQRRHWFPSLPFSRLSQIFTGEGKADRTRSWRTTIGTKVIWRKMILLKRKNRANLRYREQAICFRQSSSNSEAEQEDYLRTKEMTLWRWGRIQSFCATRLRSCLAKKLGSRSQMRWTRVCHSSLACLVWQASLVSNHRATSHSKPEKSSLPHITHTTRSVSAHWRPWSTRTRISPWPWIPKMSRSSSIQIKVQRLKIWFASLKIARALLLA